MTRLFGFRGTMIAKTVETNKFAKLARYDKFLFFVWCVLNNVCMHSFILFMSANRCSCISVDWEMIIILKEKFQGIPN